MSICRYTPVLTCEVVGANVVDYWLIKNYLCAPQKELTYTLFFLQNHGPPKLFLKKLQRTCLFNYMES